MVVYNVCLPTSVSGLCIKVSNNIKKTFYTYFCICVHVNCFEHLKLCMTSRFINHKNQNKPYCISISDCLSFNKGRGLNFLCFSRESESTVCDETCSYLLYVRKTVTGYLEQSYTFWEIKWWPLKNILNCGF